jgi:hypothetical protein
VSSAARRLCLWSVSICAYFFSVFFLTVRVDACTCVYRYRYVLHCVLGTPSLSSWWKYSCRFQCNCCERSSSLPTPARERDAADDPGGPKEEPVPSDRYCTFVFLSSISAIKGTDGHLRYLDIVPVPQVFRNILLRLSPQLCSIIQDGLSLIYISCLRHDYMTREPHRNRDNSAPSQSPRQT